MAEYDVRFADSFLADLEILLEDTERWGEDATRQYAAGLWQLAKNLGFMPYRYSVDLTVSNPRFRSALYKAHKVIYEVNEPDKQVVVLRCIRATRNLKALLDDQND